jgi:DNA recombination protein RmuC
MENPFSISYLIFFLILLVATLFLIKIIIQNLALKALRENQKSFLELAEQSFQKLRASSNEDLDSKKTAIEKQLSQLNAELDKLKTNTTELKANIQLSKEQLTSLTETTNQLNSVLSNNQKRGQWGERQAEDLLQHFDFQEGINYNKQTSEGGDRPDFTFYLPKGKRLNMDVKFPISAFQSYLDAESKSEQESHLKQFNTDIKTHLKAIAKRKYINPADDTLDYCIMFISNEGIFQIVNQQQDLLDLAKDLSIVICGPTSLFAILSLIRQSVSSFHIEERAKIIQKDLLKFQDEWEKYKDKMASVQTKMDQAGKALEEAQGTRTRALERPLQNIISHEIDSHKE